MRKVKWTDEKLEKEAKKYNTRGEFKKWSCGAYLASYKRGKAFLDSVCEHMVAADRKIPVKWTNEKLAKEAKKYSTRVEFQNGSMGAYLAAVRRGPDFMNEVCAHMRQARESWSEEKLAKEAKKYSTRGEFNKGSTVAYKTAHAKGKNFLDMVCAHMEAMRESWTDERLAEEAKKYKTRSEFDRGSSAYQRALTRGADFMNKICSHMEEGIGGGFKRSSGGFLYQFRVVRGEKVYYKVGISNNDPLYRAQQFGVKDGVYIERTHAIWYECGDECRQAEKALHTAAKENGLQYIGRDLMKNGFTEIFTKPLLH